MTTFEKLKLILSSGDKKVLLKHGELFVCISSIVNEGVVCSDPATNRWDALNFCLSATYTEERLKNLEIVEVVPVIHKEIKSKVGIIDCPEIRELAERGHWSKEAIEMIGNKGFEVNCFIRGNLGDYYTIYQKDGKGFRSFPAWAIYGCNDEDEEDKEVIARLEKKGYKITRE